MSERPEESAKALAAAAEAAKELQALRAAREAKQGKTEQPKASEKQPEVTSDVIVEEEVVAEDTNEETTSRKVEVPTDREYTDLEKEQMEFGWDPHKENGVSAAEYKRVGEIIEAKRRASKEAKELRQALAEQDKKLTKVVKFYENLEADAYKKAKADLEAELDAKVLEGDVQGVRAVRLKQETLEARAAQERNTQAQQEAPEFVQFKEEFKDVLNGTSATDIAIQGYISKRAAEFQKTNPNIDPKIALDDIRKGIKEAFPQRYATTNPNQAKPSKVATSTVSTNTKQYSLAALDVDQKLVFEQIKKADPSQTVEKFIKRLQAVGRMPK